MSNRKYSAADMDGKCMTNLGPPAPSADGGNEDKAAAEEEEEEEEEEEGR